VKKKGENRGQSDWEGDQKEPGGAGQLGGETIKKGEKSRGCKGVQGPGTVQSRVKD